jgi:hypothetical protein
MGRSIDLALQTRVRALLGLRGGPPIEAEEAILPVAVIAGYPILRQPQLETSDLIPRRFWVTYEEVVAGAGSHARIGVRSGDVRSIIWLTRMWAYSRDADGAVEARIGRSDTWAFATSGVTGFQDHRLGDLDLAPSPVDGGANEFAAGANATFHGNLQLLIPGRSTAQGAFLPLELQLDEILVTDGVAPDAFTVELVTVDRDLICSFEGYVFDLGR